MFPTWALDGFVSLNLMLSFCLQQTFLENCLGSICGKNPLRFFFRRTWGALVLSALLHREKISLLGGGRSV